MSKTIETKGKCLCGKVEIHAKKLQTQIGACHCTSCRTWGGGPFLAIDGGEDVVFTGEEYISIYNSSDWAERGFCKNCGTNLFYHLKKPSKYILTVGLFGEDNAFNFDHQVFIDEKPGYYNFANETKNMTGEECFAAFSACQEKND